MIDPSLKHAQHLAELEAAEVYLARGYEIIERHKERARRLKATGGSRSGESRKLSELLEITQRNFKRHVEMLKRELGWGEEGPPDQSVNSRGPDWVG